MGSCLSSRIKADSPSTSGVKSRCSGKDGKSGISTSSCSGSGGGGGGSRVSAAASAPPTPRSEGEILQSSNLHSFSFGDLKSATRNFRPDSVLGEGGFGSVFKGWIDEKNFTAVRPGTGMVIAVKRLNLEGMQGHTEWLTEINYLGRLHHPNLVKLIGYCLEDEHRMLVYEFMPRGSLENHLFRRASYFQPLSWNLRMQVALGAAKGLAFLHSPEIGVIYRDFKSSNILLDSTFSAKLSDFGLAKDGPGAGKSHVSTRVMGTYGYAAPEYMATGHLTAKSDVYSFGVVLLEMLSGRRALDKNRPSHEQNLVEWARPYLGHRRRVFRVVDPRLDGQYSQTGAYKAATLAVRCLSNDPKNRPSMRDVVAVLEQLQNAKDMPAGAGATGAAGSGGVGIPRRQHQGQQRGSGNGNSTAARLKTRSLDKDGAVVGNGVGNGAHIHRRHRSTPPVASPLHG